jgi:hypothetical protein
MPGNTSVVCAVAFHATRRNSFRQLCFSTRRVPRVNDKPSNTYKNCIKKRFSDPGSWDFAPDFIGSLQYHFYRRTCYSTKRLDYAAYPACVNDQNIAVQFLLWIVTNIVSGYGTQPPMTVPEILKKLPPVDTIEITGPTVSGGRNAAPEWQQP